MINGVEAALSPATELRLWKASLFADESYTSAFREFKKRRGAPLPALPPLDSLPSPPASTDSTLPEDLVGHWTQIAEQAERDTLPAEVRRCLRSDS